MSKLTAKGFHNGNAGIALGIGSLSAVGTVNAFGTSTFIGDLAAIGEAPFVPTYDGAQSPTVVAEQQSIWGTLSFPVSGSDADADQEIFVRATYIGPANCWIGVDGDLSGGDDDEGSSFIPVPALKTIMLLNETPDSVTIRLVEAPYVDTDHATWPSTVTKIGSFTDNVPFFPLEVVKYGYLANAHVEATDGFNDGQITPIVEFTFKKVGFADLVVTYKIRAEASCQSEEDEDPEEN